MALAYLLDPCQQYSNRAGVNNVNGYFEVFRMDTDDRATVYVDFNGTLAPEHIGIDNDGRAVMIVESGRPYRVEMHGPSGDLFWTQQPVWPLAGGGGGISGTDIVSTDGSIAVDKTTVGSVTTYDLSSNVEDGTDLLGWIRCDGASNIDGTDIWKPTYTAGTLMVGERGIMLTGGQYFHATARVCVMKSAVSGYYDDMQLIFKLSDGDTSTEVARQGIVVDGSMPLYQDFEISCDTLPEFDCELVLEIVGKELTSLNIQVLDTEVHRVFSGAPYIPDGVASKPWVENNYQEKLTAGANITIDENNVISASGSFTQVQADWECADSNLPQFIRNKPQNLVQDAAYVHTDNNLTTTLKDKLDGIEAGAQVNVKPDWTAAAGSTSEILNKPNLSTVATTGAYSDLSGRPSIPTATSQLTNDSGFLTLQTLPAMPVQGVEVNGTNVVNAQGVAEVVVPAQVNADWTEASSASPAYIANKPVVKNLIAGTGITITETAQGIVIALA